MNIGAVRAARVIAVGSRVVINCCPKAGEGNDKLRLEWDVWARLTDRSGAGFVEIGS